MCNCLKCPNAKMSFSSTRSDFDVAATLSYKFTCSALGREIANVTNPRIGFPTPDDCPRKGENVQGKDLMGKIIDDMLSWGIYYV